MSQETKQFALNQAFPDSSSILGRSKRNLNEILTKAVYVLDTNSLLAPYNSGKKTISEIENVYRTLIGEGRLFIPEHVLREFAKNRSVKVSDLFTNIDNQISSIHSPGAIDYPILEELKVYKDLKKSREKIEKLLKQYRQELTTLRDSVTSWNWSDPLTSSYSEIFDENIILKSTQDEEELLKEFIERVQLGIPPGNRDYSKDANAIGDFIIWKNILELGKKKKRDVVFVSNDEKNDWMLKGNSKSINTRYELVDEFYRYTNGKEFASITFHSFLELRGVEDAIAKMFVEIPKPKIKSTPSGPIAKPFPAITDKFDLRTVMILLSEIVEILDTYSLIGGRFLQNERLVTLGELFNHQAKLSYSDDFSLANSMVRTLNSILREINDLNYIIQFEESRAKRDTEEEQEKLEKLVDHFLSNYQQYKGQGVFNELF